MVKKLNKAVILAAGTGSRLKHILKGKPKPLLRVGKTTLLENLIKNLNSLNIKKIVVVVGYKSKMIKKEIKNKVKFIFYPEFKLKNNLHTLFYIKKELNEPLLCLFSDVLFSRKILQNLLKNQKDMVLAVDKKTRLSGTMRVKIRGKQVTDIGSHIKAVNADGNFIGFAKFSKKGCEILKKTLINFKNSNLNYYYTEIFNYLAKKKIYANFIDVSKLNWKEIDTKKDFIQAKKIYKRILDEEKK